QLVPRGPRRGHARAAVPRGARISRGALGRPSRAARGPARLGAAGDVDRDHRLARRRHVAARPASLRSIRCMSGSRRRRSRRAADTEDGFEGRGSLHRHARLVAVQLRIRTLAALEYRAGFWTGGVLGLFWSLGGVIPLVVALEHRPDVAGWTPWALAMLIGCHMIVNGLFGAVVQPAL